MSQVPSCPAAAMPWHPPTVRRHRNGRWWLPGLGVLCWLALAPQTAVSAPRDGESAEADAEVADEPARGASRARGRTGLKWGVDRVRLEGLHWPSAPQANAGLTLRSQPYLQWQSGAGWELRLGARVDADVQRGRSLDRERTRLDWADTFIRFRTEGARVSVGAQTVIWGRVDGVPVIDRVSRVDLRRFGLDNLQDRRLPQWMLRWEQELGDFRLDTVWIARHEASELPADGGVWHPINRNAAQIIGVAPFVGMSSLFRSAALRTEPAGSGGLAMRVTRAGEGLDLGLTLARTRQPLPYFRLDAVRGQVLMSHPFNRFIAIDAELVAGGATWRSELGYTRDLPLTRLDGTTLKTSAVDWVGAVEFFPGGKNLRVNLQLVSHVARAKAEVYEVKRYHGANGEVEVTFGQDRWKAGLRFAAGFNIRDTYLAPSVSYTGWEPHEIYLTAHLFSGESRALAGFHRQHDAVALGVKTKF